MKIDDTYIRLTEARNTTIANLGGKSGALALDYLDEQILCFVARQQLAGKAVNVSDIMTRREWASPATLHKRLQSLVEKNLLAAKPVPGHYPNKSVKLTASGSRLLTSLGKTVRSVVGNA